MDYSGTTNRGTVGAYSLSLYAILYFMLDCTLSKYGILDVFTHTRVLDIIL